MRRRRGRPTFNDAPALSYMKTIIENARARGERMSVRDAARWASIFLDVPKTCASSASDRLRRKYRADARNLALGDFCPKHDLANHGSVAESQGRASAMVKNKTSIDLPRIEDDPDWQAATAKPA